METWSIDDLELEARRPQVLASTEEGRAVALALPGGEALNEHQVHERAWVVVISGAVEVLDSGGDPTEAGAGALFVFDPNERHEVRAREDSRLLLLLTPWPGDGHPGAMTLDQKGGVRDAARAMRAD